MPLDALTPDELEKLTRYLRRALDGEKYQYAPATQELRAILAKLCPPVPVQPVKPPLPGGKSMVLASRKRARRG